MKPIDLFMVVMDILGDRARRLAPSNEQEVSDYLDKLMERTQSPVRLKMLQDVKPLILAGKKKQALAVMEEFQAASMKPKVNFVKPDDTDKPTLHVNLTQH